jgi:hypothetical protein
MIFSPLYILVYIFFFLSYSFIIPYDVLKRELSNVTPHTVIDFIATEDKDTPPAPPFSPFPGSFYPVEIISFFIDNDYSHRLHLKTLC